MMYAPAYVVSETGRVRPLTGLPLPEVVAPTPRRADLLVDTYTEDFGASFREAGSALLARVRVTRAVALTAIGVRNRMIRDGLVRFLVFDAETGELLHASEPQAFPRGPMGEKISPTFPPLVLKPGRAYALGAVADADADWGWERGPV
jgi:hypothetical protein